MNKKLLKLTAVTALVSILAVPSFGAKRIKWKLAMTWPSTLTPLATPPQKLATLVKEMSGGKFRLNGKNWGLKSQVK